MSEKIIRCDCDHDNVKIEEKVFQQAGIDYSWHHCIEQDDVIKECSGATVFLNQYAYMDEKIFKALPTLKCIVRYGVGVDNVNLKDATKYGVQVCNVPDYGTCEVADQALALMMTLTRKVSFVNEQIRKGTWDYSETIPVHRLSDCTVGIIGLGRIGTEFAKRVNSLGCRTIAYDVAFSDKTRTFSDIAEKVDLNTLLKESDIISIHCSLNDSTNNLIDENAFKKMKNSSFIINVARGGIIDEAALLKALEKKMIAGAGLDVVKDEHLDKENPLLKFDNFIVSPHMAWYSEESALDLKKKAAEEAVRFINGEKVRNPVNTL